MCTTRFSGRLSYTHTPLSHMPPSAMHPSPLPAAPAVNRITDRCKNIIFPQLRLREVKMLLKWGYCRNIE